MLPFIIGGIAVAAAITAGTTIYKKFSSDDEQPVMPENEIESLGSFAIWGRPDSGKTTFVYRIQQKDIPKEKEATSSRREFRDIKPISIRENKFKIDEITDLPGTIDRKRTWVDLVKNKKHVFYLVNLARLSDKKYLSEVKNDLKITTEAISALKTDMKPIHIIGTHIDESDFKNILDADVNNKLQENSEIRAILESIKYLGDELKNSDGIKGFLYSVNLTELPSFNKLIENIINDIK